MPFSSRTPKAVIYTYPHRYRLDVQQMRAVEECEAHDWPVAGLVQDHYGDRSHWRQDVLSLLASGMAQVVVVLTRELLPHPVEAALVEVEAAGGRVHIISEN